MKKLFLHLLVSLGLLAVSCEKEPPVTLPSNATEISYTSVDGEIVVPYDANAFGSEIVSNTYEDGVGKIHFKSPLLKIGELAFSECLNLKTITLPSCVKEIGKWAFSGCDYLTNADIGNGVVTIDESAFGTCSRLKEITLPKSIKNVGDSAFFGCSGMSAFYGKFASADNRCLIINKVLVHFAPKGLKTYEIAEGVTTIGHDSFYNSSLTEITIPQSVIAIQDFAFYYSESLNKVYCKSTIPPTLGTNVFDNFENGSDIPIGCRIYVPTASVEAYKNAENWKTYARYITGHNF